MLAILAKRILRAFDDEIECGEILLAIVTSDESENREFEKFSSLGVRVFYGSRSNIPLRHLHAAQALDVDAIVAVDGDDILCSTEAMRVVCDGLSSGGVYVKTSGLPLGMNAFGYRREFLAASLAGNEKKTLETGWGSIFDDSRMLDCSLDLGFNTKESLRFTLDYPEDYEFFKSIVERFGESIVSVSDGEIVTYVLEKELDKLTDPVSDKYWEDFRVVQANEIRQGKNSEGA